MNTLRGTVNFDLVLRRAIETAAFTRQAQNVRYTDASVLRTFAASTFEAVLTGSNGVYLGMSKTLHLNSPAKPAASLHQYRLFRHSHVAIVVALSA
jgi:hypothetical protein